LTTVPQIGGTTKYSTRSGSTTPNDGMPWDDVAASTSDRVVYMFKFLKQWEIPRATVTDHVEEHISSILKPGSEVDPDTGEVHDMCYKMQVRPNEEKWVTVPRARIHLRHGCSNCLGHSSVNDVVWWLSTTVHFCDDCIDLPVVKDVVRAQGGTTKSQLVDLSANLKLGYA
jgi:hypothetical protein